MAIDFPNTPTVNQTFTVNGRTWTWNGTTWDANVNVLTGPTGQTGPIGPTGPRGNYYESDTAPSTPSQGDAWFNTTDATMYIYYGTAWVEPTSNLNGGVGATGATGPTGSQGRYTASDTAPVSPVTGDAWFNTTDGRLYIYYGGAWIEPNSNLIGPTGPTRFTTSDTAPVSPSSGDAWFDSSRGQTYVYYADGTSSQWIQIGSAQAGPTGAAGTITVASNSPIINTGSNTAASLSFDSSYLSQAAGKNVIINGGFDFWQRGASFSVTTSAIYTADRWYASGSGGATTCVISQQTTGAAYGTAAHARVSYSTNSAFLNIFNALESNVVKTLQGRTVTVSFKARRNSTYVGGLNLELSTNTVADTMSGTWTALAAVNISNANLPTGTTSTDWATGSFTVTVPAGTLGLRVRVGEDTTQSTGAYYEVSAVQLEIGPTATPFSRAGGTYQGEQAACLRYYWSPTAEANPYMPIATGYAATTTTGFALFEFPVPMRIKPTFSVDSVSNFQMGFTQTTNYALTSLTQNTDGTSTKRGLVAYVSATMGTSTQVSMLYRSAGLGLTGSIGWNAEL